MRVRLHLSIAYLLSFVLCGCGRSTPPPAPSAAATSLIKPVVGTVLDPDGNPVADALVVVSQGRGELDFRQMETDAEGRFSLELQGFPESSEIAWANVYKPGLAVAGARLSAGDNSTSLTPSRQLEGTVLDTSGRPVPGMTVVLKAVSLADPFAGFRLGGAVAQEFSIRTGADGRWAMRDLPLTGIATLAVIDPRFIGDETSVDLAHAGKAGLTLIARPGGSIQGRVIYRDGRPAPGMSIFAQLQNGDMEGMTGMCTYAQSVTDADGKYQLPGLPDGTFNVNVDVPSGEWIAAAREDVSVSPPLTVHLADFVLTRGALVTGQVIDGTTGEPFPGVIIGSYGPHRPQSSSSIISTGADAEGRYQLRVAPGESYVYVAGVPSGYDNPGSTVDLAEGETETLDFLVQPDRGPHRHWWPF
jgi:hypothetical protein